MQVALQATGAALTLYAIAVSTANALPLSVT